MHRSKSQVSQGAITLVVIVLALIGIGIGVAVAVGDGSSSSSSTSPTAGASTPLGCAPGATGVCTDAALASRMCGVDLIDSPNVMSSDDGRQIMTQWVGPGITVWSVWHQDAQVQWNCVNNNIHAVHALTFTHSEWVALHSAGPASVADSMLNGR
jgi:hypothetical protein